MPPEPEQNNENHQLDKLDDRLRLPTSVLVEDPRYRIKPMQQVISALIGGLITTFVVTPLEVVKTRVQTQHTVRKRPTVSKLCYVFHNGLMTHICKPDTECIPKPGRAPDSLRPLRGAMDVFVKIICSNGASGLWSGLSPTLVSALPSTIIYFLTYEYLKNSFGNMYYLYYNNDRLPAISHAVDPNKDAVKTNQPSIVSLPAVVPMAAGICSRTAVVTAVTPIEMVRIKMQSGYITYTELWQVVGSLIRSKGLLGLWRGWPPTVMRDAPFSGTYWAAYESMKRAFNVTEPTFGFSFLTGAASGALATWVTMPFDLITTHTQIELGQDVLYSDGVTKGKVTGKGGGSTGLASENGNRQSVFRRLGHIYRQQGIRGLYVGVIPRMLRVVPACAIMISTFEYSKAFFFHYNLDLKETGKQKNITAGGLFDKITSKESKPGNWIKRNINMSKTAVEKCKIGVSGRTNTMTDPRFRIRPLQQVASACTGAMITASFMTPLDVVKTRLQAQQSLLLSQKCFLYCNGLMDHICPCGPNANTAKPAPHFSGTIDAFIKISRSEGIGSLWSGLSPTLISALPSTIIYFVAYEQFKARFTDFHYKYLTQSMDSTPDVPILVPLMAGVAARILAVTCVSPIEMIRTKMQSQKMSHAEMLSSVRQVVQSQGILGLWRGLPPTILRDVPFSGIYWTSYEYLKSTFNVVEPSFGFSFMAGAISGSVAAAITTPFDVIKTHDQIEFGEKFIFSGRPRSIAISIATSNTTDLGNNAVCLTVDNPQPPSRMAVNSRSVTDRLASIYRLGGIRGIFAGLGPRLFKVAPACAIMISTFEYGKSFFYHYNVDQHNEMIKSQAATPLLASNIMSSNSYTESMDK